MYLKRLHISGDVVYIYEKETKLVGSNIEAKDEEELKTLKEIEKGNLRLDYPIATRVTCILGETAIAALIIRVISAFIMVYLKDYRIDLFDLERVQMVYTGIKITTYLLCNTARNCFFFHLALDLLKMANLNFSKLSKIYKPTEAIENISNSIYGILEFGYLRAHVLVYIVLTAIVNMAFPLHNLR